MDDSVQCWSNLRIEYFKNSAFEFLFQNSQGSQFSGLLRSCRIRWRAVGREDWGTDRITKVTDLEIAWSRCCSAQCPGQTTFSVWSILRTVSSLPSTTTRGSVNTWWICCTFPSLMMCGRWPVCRLGSGGLKLRDAGRFRTTVYWSRRADTVPVLPPSTCGRPHSGLTVRGRGGFHLEAAIESRDHVLRLGGCIRMGRWWTERPGFHPDNEFPRFSRMGWQSFAATEIDEVFFRTTVWPRLDPTHRASVRSETGSMARILFFTPPVSTASGSTLRVSGSSFCVASGASSLCVLQLVGVASHLIHVVTTGELALTQGFLVAAGSRWKVALHESAERQAPGCRSTFVSKTWISIHGREQITAVWKWSPTVCLSSTAHSLPWTQRWSAQCELTEPPGGSVQNGTKPYPELTGEQGRAGVVVLACVMGRRWFEEAQSFLRHLARARARSEPRERCDLQRGGLGALLWRVAPLRRLRRPCWSAEAAWEPTGRSRRPLTSFGMTTMEVKRSWAIFLGPWLVVVFFFRSFSQKKKKVQSNVGHNNQVLTDTWNLATQNSVICSNQISENFRSGHDCDSAFLQEALVILVFKQISQFCFFRKVRKYTVLTRTWFHKTGGVLSSWGSRFLHCSVEVLSSNSTQNSGNQSGNTCDTFLSFFLLISHVSFFVIRVIRICSRSYVFDTFHHGEEFNVNSISILIQSSSLVNFVSDIHLWSAFWSDTSAKSVLPGLGVFFSCVFPHSICHCAWSPDTMEDFRV